jgi:hypothetical protein
MRHPPNRAPKDTPNMTMNSRWRMAGATAAIGALAGLAVLAVNIMAAVPAMAW